MFACFTFSDQQLWREIGSSKRSTLAVSCTSTVYDWSPSLPVLGPALLSNVFHPESHWKHAAELVSLDVMEPLYALVLEDEVAARQMRTLSQGYLRPLSFSGGSYKKFLTEENSRIPQKFRNFIINWQFSDGCVWEFRREILEVFFVGPIKAARVRAFLSERLEVEDILPHLAKMRDDAMDRAVIEAVERCEAAIGDGEISDWDEAVLAERIGPDPFVDVSYPVYRGYQDRATFACIRRLFRERLGNRIEMARFLGDFRRLVEIKNDKAWLDLIDD